MKAFRAILLAVALCGFGVAMHAELANGIHAIVHDAIITYHDVENNAAAAIEQLRQYANQPRVYNQKLTEVLNDSLEHLVERQLILHEFATAGYVMPETVIDEYVEERIRGQFRDRVTFTKSLQEEGSNYERFRQEMRDRFIESQMRIKNVSGELIISPHKIESYYLAHTNDYKMDDEVKLRMIVLNKPVAGDPAQVRKLAEEIIRKIKEGAAFAEMAGVYSEGRQGREGGDWGWVQKFDRDGALVLRKELAEIAFSLKPGELSGVIETPEVIYLMLVEDKRPSHFKALSEVRGEIERNMLTQERERIQKQWIERLKQKTFVRYF
ncbi:MAG TPA: peptidylprolyl isomerase [Verrucomicrobiae bacterium]|nr:peptidylprolyl isomerase [Verrucomicrobiae bacterium]